MRMEHVKSKMFAIICCIFKLNHVLQILPWFHDKRESKCRCKLTVKTAANSTFATTGEKTLSKFNAMVLHNISPCCVFSPNTTKLYVITLPTNNCQNQIRLSAWWKRVKKTWPCYVLGTRYSTRVNEHDREREKQIKIFTQTDRCCCNFWCYYNF